MLIGIVAAFDLFITVVGPEWVLLGFVKQSLVLISAERNHGSHFEKHRTAFEEDGSLQYDGESIAKAQDEKSFGADGQVTGVDSISVDCTV